MRELSLYEMISGGCLLSLEEGTVRWVGVHIVKSVVPNMSWSPAIFLSGVHAVQSLAILMVPM